MGRHMGSKNKICKKIKRVCSFCHKDFFTIPAKVKIGKGKFCSKKCANFGKRGKRCSPETEFKKGFIPTYKGKHLVHSGSFKPGALHRNWKGGRLVVERGYIYVKADDHPFKLDKGYYPEHRLVMEKHLGRYLKSKEVVHHINGDTGDNRILNLMLFKNNAEHIKFHREIERR